jgi:hypothetical protein
MFKLQASRIAKIKLHAWMSSRLFTHNRCQRTCIGIILLMIIFACCLVTSFSTGVLVICSSNFECNLKVVVEYFQWSNSSPIGRPNRRKAGVESRAEEDISSLRIPEDRPELL